MVNKRYQIKGQYLTYSIFTKDEQLLVNKIVIGDEVNLERMRFDSKLRRQLIATTDARPMSDAERMAQENLYYKPLFSPLVNFENELAIFNHTNNFLEFYSFDGIIQRYMPITYHQSKKWNKQILFDKITKKVYTVFDTKKGKSIYEINLEDGTAQSILFFECDFLEKMEVHNGHLFYLESGIMPSESRRILHRVELK